VSLPSLSRYEVLGRLAIGGMAEVWLARATGIAGFEKLVVLKTILPGLMENEQFLQMFINEARIAALLNHPNCVQIYDLGKEDDVLFISMEYIEGFSFSRMLKRAATLNLKVPMEIVVRVACDALSGLDHAHRLADREGKPVGLIHRDVSPDNLLLSFRGHTKVVDFGIAKAGVGTHVITRAGTVRGKYGYVAPEYLMGQPIDGRADLFAMGVVLYRALTGRRPFSGVNELELSQAVVHDTPVPPGAVFARIPQSLSDVVMRALEKSPAARFASARDMRVALEAAVPPAAPDEVGAFLSRLWPPDAPERQALESLAAGRIGETSGPLLESVIIQDESPGEAPSLATPHALSARDRATPQAGVTNTHATSHPTVRTPVPPDPGPEPDTSPGSRVRPLLTPQELAPREGAQEATRRESSKDVARREANPQFSQDAWAALAQATGKGRPSKPDLAPVAGPEAPVSVPQRPSRPDLIAAANAMLAAVGPPASDPKSDLKATQRVEAIPKPRPSHPDQMHTVNAKPSPELLRTLQLQGQKGELYVTVNRAPDAHLLRAAAGPAAPAPPPDEAMLPEPAYVADDRFLDVPPEPEDQPKTQVGTPVFPRSAPAPLPTELQEDDPPPRRGLGPRVWAVGAQALLAAPFLVVRSIGSGPHNETEPAPALATPPPPAAAPAPHPLGKIEVELQEAVTVLDGDTELGASPGPFELEPGPHTLRVTSKSWGIDQELSVTVNAGETVKVIGPLKHGTLQVRATPWAMVKLDGRPIGQTPLKPRDVYEGTHVVDLYNSELEVNKRLEVKVSAGESKTLNVRMNE
jgi:serine/threonine-protein kinase